MVITVYDWKNRPKFIDVPAESIDDIASIDISIVSGDETGCINLKDGTIILFDASDGRENGRYFMILQARDDEYVRKKIEVTINKALKAMIPIVTRRLLRGK